MERRPDGSNGVTTGRRIHKTSTKELGTHYTYNRRISKEHEMTVRQKETKPTRTESWRPCVARKQKYPFELTLKEAG